MSCFLMFFHRYLKATLFSLKTKNHTVILLIMGGQNVDISLVLGMVLEIYVFRRCVFSDFLLRFRCKNHVHWWSPRLKNSGNPCAKVIILVFFVFSILWHLEKHVKIIKFRSPFGVTHKGFSVIFMKIWRSTYGKSSFPESLWSLYIKHFEAFQGRSHAARNLIG